VRKAVHFAWEHAEDDRFKQQGQLAFPPDPQRAPRAGARGDRLAFAMAVLAIALVAAKLWHGAKIAQRSVAYELVSVLELPSSEHASARRLPSVEQVHYRGRKAFVQIGGGHEAGVNQAVGEVVLLRDGESWQRIAPAGSDWGARQRLETNALAIAFWAKDGATVRSASAQANAQHAYIRRQLGLAASPMPLDFMLSPDTLGMPATDARTHVVVMPRAEMTEAERIAYLTDALLQPLVAQTVRALAGAGAENPTWEPLLVATQDWLMVNAYPRMSADFTDSHADGYGVLGTGTLTVRPSFPLHNVSDWTEDDVTAVIDNVVAQGSYAGLAALLRATAIHGEWGVLLESWERG
jgi:hypothetical protein